MRPLAVLFGAFLLLSPLVSMFYSPAGVVEAGSLPSWNKVFHLHDGTVQAAGLYDWMNSSGPSNPFWTDYDMDGLPGITIKKNVPPQRYHEWILYPQVETAIDISGTMVVHVWAKSQGNDSGTIVSAQFYDVTQSQFSTPLSAPLIGQGTSGLVGPFYSEFQMVNITIPSVAYTLPQGHFLSLVIQRGDSLNDWLIVWYDRTIYDSYVTLTSSKFVSVDEAHLEDSSGVPRTKYSELEDVIVSANVSDPFGSYDIAGANVTVSYSGNGTEVASSLPLTVVRTDSSPIPYWEVLSLTLPRFGNGTFTANVTASDSEGYPYPTWFTSDFTIVSVDHFNVATPSRITSWEPFQMTITAQNGTNETVTDWVGLVQLQVFNADMITPAIGHLSNSTVQFNLSDNGVVTITAQTYNYSEDVIHIHASAGSKIGWSPTITVASGPAIALSISSGNVTMSAGNTTTFDVTGLDVNGNVNTSWAAYWNVVGGIGTVVPNGLSANFLATAIGTGKLECTNNATGASTNITITVISGTLVRINISAPAYPLLVHENESVDLTATGYDSYGNVVSIAWATWDTTISGSISGTGSSATLKAGTIPQTGVVNVRLGSVVGSLEVTVTNAINGPWLNPVPVQIQSEDVGRWELSLNGLWQDSKGTNKLFWWVENVDSSLYFITHDPDRNWIMVFYTQLDQFGVDEFTLWVINDEGFRTFQNVTVRILPVNDPPRFVNDVATELYVKFDVPYSFDYTYYVWDVDDAKLNLTMSSNAPEYSPSATWNISFEGLQATFLFKHKGDLKSYFEIVTLTVTDPGGLSDKKTIVVKVTDDTPPALKKNLENQTIYEGTIDQWAFNLDDYFYDPDSEPLFYTSGFENIPPPVINSTHDVFFSAPGEWSGVTYGTFVAKDATGALKVYTISVTVIPVNDPPVVKNVTDIIHVKYGLPYYLYMGPYITDPDNTLDSLTIQVSDSHVTIGFSDTGAERFELLFPANLSGPVYTGPYQVTVWVTVRDPGLLSASGYFTVLVTDNVPPSVIAPKPDQLYVSFPENTQAVDILMLYSIFSDSDDIILNFTLVSNGTRTHYNVSSNGAVSLYADNNWSGSEIYTITAKDSKGAWARVQVTVVVTPVNQAPVATLLKSKLITIGGPRTLVYELSYFVNFYDSDNDVLTIRVSPDANAVIVGDKIYVTLPSGVDSITISLVANDGEFDSNTVSIVIGIEKTIAQKIGYPYTLPLVLLAAGIIGYFLGGRIPRPYSLENLFLIHNDGRLVAHVTREENTNLDKDVVSAMFTAVQEFVRDSFQKGEVGLKKLEIGDKNVLIEKGHSAYLALIYSGWPQKETLSMLPILLRDIEERYKSKLERWNGTAKAVVGVEKMLQEYMAAAFKPGAWHEEEEIAEEEWVDILNKET